MSEIFGNSVPAAGQAAQIAELQASVFHYPENLYEGDILEGGYYNNETFVENATYKMAFLPFGAIRSGDVITWSEGFDYYNGSYRLDAFSADGTWLGLLYSGQSTTTTIIGIDATNDFKIGMRLKTIYDESELVIVKGSTLERTDKVAEAYQNASRSVYGILNGKKINCLGDSFTYPGNAWHYWLAKRTNCTVNNYGVSSSRISVDRDSILSFLSRYSTMDQTADITIIFGGINDAASIAATTHGVTLGNINSTKDNTTFYGALKLLIESIKLLMPGKKIIGVIPPDFSDNENYINTLPQVQNACREVYEYYSIPYADLKKDCQEMYKDEYNLATYRKVTSSDENYHPSEAGHEAISEIIQAKIESVLRG